MNNYRAGIDIGSTTVKVVILDENDDILFGQYRRHNANIHETLVDLLKEARGVTGDRRLKIKVTGSGSINLGKSLGIEFVQEVVAVSKALKKIAPQTDVAIELGGEDAKIIYFTDGLEERMNGVCAGGTGAFIDQMAALLQTDAQGLNKAAEVHEQIYPIAARCGVFAEPDIQPLINEGANVSDIAASIFQAVVNQTVSGLACGKPIRGNVAFLGGPLHFMPELKKTFVKTLGLNDQTTIDPENSHLFAAFGAALMSVSDEEVEISDVLGKLENGIKFKYEMPRLEALFDSEAEYEMFELRHSKSTVEKEDISAYKGNCFLGIDAGSTTTKIVLIGSQGQVLYSYYSGNKGDPIRTIIDGMVKLREVMPSDARIVRSCSTGYGETMIKSAFSLDEGAVETMAHSKAALFFDPDTDCILDIGGQDMKCIKLKNDAVEDIVLNEACSSGCGSFIENFAASLGFTAEQFAEKALFASAPVDLGTRCTVFMNSNVKQAQKEGADTSDISAGLAYSVIKNALYKVIKITSANELGQHIVVQGGTFKNKAVLRAFEKISGVDVICPDIAGLMGAFGAALIAKENYSGQQSKMLSLDEIIKFEYSSVGVRCKKCQNNCMLTVNTFPGGRKHISGNRCERGEGKTETGKSMPNMVEYKRQRIFDYEPLEMSDAKRGVIGIPRVLNIYENYPFWAVFFKELGFKVVLSPFSDRKIYEMGMDSIPSESECYPAKLAHGHIEWLISNGVKTIFHPCVFYERQENKNAQNHFNCPIVISYAENIKNNVEHIADNSVKYIRPFIAFTDEKTAAERLITLAKEEWDIPEKEVVAAVHKAWDEQLRVKEDIRWEGKRRLIQMENKGERGIVLAGRPYHIDPEINHGIPELISSYGFYVFTEDSLPTEQTEDSLRVVDQWVFHSRLYGAASFVARRDDLELIQLNSFGCGLDAVTTDQVAEILRNSDKLYTLLKIDEVNNLGAAKIRVRSLIAAMDIRKEKGISTKNIPVKYNKAEFTKKMFDEGYTILVPQMSPIHFGLLEPVFKKYGYNVVVLDNDTREAIDTGLKFVNNDACFPSITVVGQIMQAVLSEKYNTDKLAVIMSQTGGCCRASNYVAFIRRALEKVGMSHIPVISFNFNGMEKNEGFRITASMMTDAVRAVVYGDLLMRCLYRVRPYEITKGSADELYLKWKYKCIDQLKDKFNINIYTKTCREIVRDFDEFPIDETLKKPRVGIVGEILVKYMPLANNHLVELLEKEGAEAVVPDLLDFYNYGLRNNIYKSEYLGKPKITAGISDIGIKTVRFIRKPALDALVKSKRFCAPMRIEDIAEITKPFLSLGNQYGEGWFLAGEMLELIHTGVDNIICIQPFGCLPNHVVGKGVIKAIRRKYPGANITAIDYDPGASEVNQLNRVKLMLSAAKDKFK